MVNVSNNQQKKLTTLDLKKNAIKFLGFYIKNSCF